MPASTHIAKTLLKELTATTGQKPADITTKALLLPCENPGRLPQVGLSLSPEQRYKLGIWSLSDDGGSVTNQVAVAGAAMVIARAPIQSQIL